MDGKKQLRRDRQQLTWEETFSREFGKKIECFTTRFCEDWQKGGQSETKYRPRRTPFPVIKSPFPVTEQNETET